MRKLIAAAAYAAVYVQGQSEVQGCSSQAERRAAGRLLVERARVAASNAVYWLQQDRRRRRRARTRKERTEQTQVQRDEELERVRRENEGLDRVAAEALEWANAAEQRATAADEELKRLNAWCQDNEAERQAERQAMAERLEAERQAMAERFRQQAQACAELSKRVLAAERRAEEAERRVDALVTELGQANERALAGELEVDRITRELALERRRKGR